MLESKAQQQDTRLLLASMFLAASLAYLSSLWWQADEERVNRARQMVAGIGLSLCNTPLLSVIMPFCGGISDDLLVNLNQRMASQKSLKTALESLNWHPSNASTNEVEALRYTAFVRGLQAGRWSDRGSDRAWELSRDAVRPVWNKYPKLAVASQPYWRFYHDSNMYEWFTASRQHDDYLASLVETIPHLLGQFHTQVKPLQSELLDLSRSQAPLAYHGNRYGFLGSVLLKHKDNAALHDLVINTNSAAPIMGHDWSLILPETVHLSWQRGMLNGDDLPQFTAKLVESGYRPALRWTVWMSAEGRRSNSLSRMARYTQSYVNILQKKTVFNKDESQAWDEFYSDNWGNIDWDETSRKWRIKQPK